MRIAIDIGGTFTDVLLYNDQSGELSSAKVPSTPKDPARAFFKGLDLLLDNAGSRIQQLDAVTHGTTIVTNALLEGNTAKVGLLVTQGFRDLLEIGRQVRPELYNLFANRLPPLVPRQLVYEIQERVGAHGQVLTPLDEQQAIETIKALVQEGVESVAIVLLFSFMIPAHEERLYSLVRKHFPKEFIFLSSQVSPEFREYERASTTVVAAAVAPSVVAYLKSIKKELHTRGWDRDTFSVLHSGGGLLSADQASERPHTLVESGPAAGVIATVELAQELGLERVIAFDMGGTTAKASLILEGKQQYTNEYEVGGQTHRAGRALGKGYPVRFPMIDLAECGAGAGSLAWIDPGGHLKVGPQSAGADPGPVCYGRGGTQPTITDAYLTLGIFSPDSFLGGEMPLDPTLAAQAIETEIANPLGLRPEEAASGILEIANANMLRILRLVSIQRGYDPRDFYLVAYGGAGPLHATTLAEQMSIRQVIVPRFPALFSALGLLFPFPSADFAQTVMLTLENENLPGLNTMLAKLEAHAEAWFKQSNTPKTKRQTQALADLRYRHQNFELTIELPSKKLHSEHVVQLHKSFHRAHEQNYGHSAPGENIQVVNLRLRALHMIDRPKLQPLGSTSGLTKLAPVAEKREVWLRGKLLTLRVYQREDLHAGHHLKGPLIVQERDATTLVEKDWQLSIDNWGNITLAHKG